LQRLKALADVVVAADLDGREPALPGSDVAERDRDGTERTCVARVRGVGTGEVAQDLVIQLLVGELPGHGLALTRPSCRAFRRACSRLTAPRCKSRQGAD